MDRYQANEIYQTIYDDPEYRMGMARKSFATQCLADVPRGTMLDVGCGRGEMLDIAQNMGFEVLGLELCQAMCDEVRVVHGEVIDLPFEDDGFHLVTMFDVMEHLPECDIYLAIEELHRVASDHILLTVSNKPSIHNGVDLHITKKSYDIWNSMFHDVFAGDVRWIPNPYPCVSELWRIDLK